MFAEFAFPYAFAGLDARQKLPREWRPQEMSIARTETLHLHLKAEDFVSKVNVLFWDSSVDVKRTDIVDFLADHDHITTFFVQSCFVRLDPADEQISSFPLRRFRTILRSIIFHHICRAFLNNVSVAFFLIDFFSFSFASSSAVQRGKLQIPH
jgi:hypothetical protein